MRRQLLSLYDRYAINTTVLEHGGMSDKRLKVELVLNALVSCTEDAIAVMSAEGTVEIWNEAATQLLGYTADEMVGRSIKTVVPDFMLPYWQARVAALDANTVFRGASVRRHKSGRLVDVSICARSIHDHTGQFSGYVLVFQDQERKGRQERSNELLAAIVRDSPTAITSVGLDFSIRTWNAAAERLFGYTEAEMIGQDVRVLLPAEDVARPGIILAEITTNKIYGFEATRIHKSGRAVPVSVVVGAQSNTASITTGWVLHYTDLTDSHAIEESRRSTEAFAHAVLDSSPDWIAIVGQDYRISNSNRNNSAGREVAQGVDWVTLWDPQRAEVLRAAFVEASSRGMAKVMAPHRLEDGHEVWFELSIVRNVATSNMHQAFIVTARDITNQVNWDKHNQLVMRELSHRAKNLLAVIDAIVRSTAGYSTTIKEFEGSFSARMRGLAKCHDLLVQKDWKGIALHTLVKEQLSHFHAKTSADLEIAVADIMLGPEAGQCLSMAVHELATNSVKYGALSSPGARLKISTEAIGEDYLLTWQESGGPEVRAPRQRGFGSEVIEEMVSETFECDARMTFNPEGVAWSARIPGYLLIKDAALRQHLNGINHGQNSNLLRPSGLASATR